MRPPRTAPEHDHRTRPSSTTAAPEHDRRTRPSSTAPDPRAPHRRARPPHPTSTHQRQNKKIQDSFSILQHKTPNLYATSQHEQCPASKPPCSKNFLASTCALVSSKSLHTSYQKVICIAHKFSLFALRLTMTLNTATGQNSDILCTFPTGYGKSLCYIIPAHVLAAPCIVVSPLCSLIQVVISLL